MENPRPRSAGVTAAATFAILGCISALCVWAYIVLNLADTPASEQGHRFYEIYTTPFLLIALLPPLVLATLMRTAIGVLQLRPWARIASMVWAALALTVSLSLIAFRPFETFVIPEHFVHEVDSLRQLFAISFVFMLLPASLWCLFLFRMKCMKAQFGVRSVEERVKDAVAGQTRTIDAHKAVI